MDAQMGSSVRTKIVGEARLLCVAVRYVSGTPVPDIRHWPSSVTWPGFPDWNRSCVDKPRRAGLHTPQEAAAIAAATASAEARFCTVTKVRRELVSDTRTAELLVRRGLRQVSLGRSSRLAANGDAQGLAVLEGVVLAGVVQRLLSDAELVRWMSRHHAKELAALQGASM
jgi:hypothetical protein